MSARLKYLSALKKVVGTILAQYDEHGIVVVIGYYVILGLIYVGAPIMAAVIGDRVFGINGAVAALPFVLLLSIPLIPLLLILLSFIAERIFMFIGIYWLFGVQSHSIRKSIQRWCGSRNA
jgi:membrane-anchored glycerophosphoryl diester phosphodiesterase (GDPDase)